MARIYLQVNEECEVSEETVNLVSGDKVFWKPTTRGARVLIEFGKKQPFRELRWIDRKELGRVVSGTVKSTIGLQQTYSYTATFIPKCTQRAQPQIIVDGGFIPKSLQRNAASKSSRTAPSPKAATRRGAAKRAARKR